MTQIEKPEEGMYAPLVCSLSTFFEQVSSVPWKTEKSDFLLESVPFSEISTFEKWTSSELEKRSTQSPEKSPDLDLPTHPKDKKQMIAV